METQAVQAATPFAVLMSSLPLLGFLAFVFTCNWKVYTKAGHPGWASLVPIYNFIVLLKIARRSPWYLALCFVPIVNIYAICSVFNGLSKSFGKGTGFTFGLILFNPIFLAILAFSDAQYLPEGPGSDNNHADNGDAHRKTA